MSSPSSSSLRGGVVHRRRHRFPSPSFTKSLVVIGAVVVAATILAPTAILANPTAADCPAASVTDIDSNKPVPPLSDTPQRGPNEWEAGCASWSTGSVPPEHRDDVCDRAYQNSDVAMAVRYADMHRFQEREGDILNLPEERTWLCPLDGTDDTTDSHNKGGIPPGPSSRWVVQNSATSAVVLSWINPLGMEVSAADGTTHPASAHSATWPDGAVLLPGQLAIVNGRMGQTFVARELVEDAGVMMEWAREQVPRTISFGHKSNGGGWENYMVGMGMDPRVFGRAGRVLLKHRMGMIHVRNQFGAICAEVVPPKEVPAPFEAERIEAHQDNSCNLVTKGFVNKVGCEIDIFFATGGSFNSTAHHNGASYEDAATNPQCEHFSAHLGAESVGNMDDRVSPVAFENTYNTHRFIAKMSHDNSIVAEMFIENDVIGDCPDPSGTKEKVGTMPTTAQASVVEVEVEEGAATMAKVMDGGFRRPVVLGYYDNVVATTKNVTGGEGAPYNALGNANRTSFSGKNNRPQQGRQRTGDDGADIDRHFRRSGFGNFTGVFASSLKSV